MRILLMFFILFSGTQAMAKSMTCTPIMICNLPEGECEPPEANAETGIFEFTDEQVILSAPDNTAPLRFNILGSDTNTGAVSYLIGLDGGHMMITLFNSGNLSMLTTLNEYGGVASSMYFSCEEAP